MSDFTLTAAECRYDGSRFSLIISLEEERKLNYPQALSYNTPYFASLVIHVVEGT